MKTSSHYREEVFYYLHLGIPVEGLADRSLGVNSIGRGWLWEAVALKAERSPDVVTVTLGETVNP